MVPLLLNLAFVAQPAPTSRPAITEITMQTLAVRIIDGDPAALDDLAVTADELYQDIDYQKERDRVLKNYNLMRSAFSRLTEAAKTGDDDALNAIYDSLAIPRLKSFAPEALGQLAATGDKLALQLLLDNEKNDILLSTASQALLPAARAQIPEAIDFFIKLRNDPAKRALWSIADDGLMQAAQQGSTQAAEARKSAPPLYQPTTAPSTSR